MTSIRTYILEEHHEAFFIWGMALKMGLVKKGACLLHFDEHSDLRNPILNSSLNNWKEWDERELLSFTSRELMIDNFIVAACYVDLMDEIVWIKHDMTRSSEKKMFVRSFNNEGRNLKSGEIRDEKHMDALEEIGAKKYNYLKLDSTNFVNFRVDIAKDILLDIDLDYFSCSENSVQQTSIVIEITKDEYQQFNASIYHPLRLIASHVETFESEGKFFYVLNNIKNLYPSSRLVTYSEIDLRMKTFFSDLANLSTKPTLITICRSRLSGFTPADQWNYIENGLISGLKCLFGNAIDVISMATFYSSQ